MTQFLTRVFAIVVVILGLTVPVMAQVNPTQSSVTEEALFEALGSGEAVAGRISIPDASAGYLIKPENKSWAALHNGTLSAISIWAILAVVVVLVVFYALRGPIRVDSGVSGRKLLRFNSIDRFAHWTLASTFIILALTGLNLIIGRSVILPMAGEAAFGTVTAWGKVAHNYLAWPFMVSLVLILVLWAMENLPRRADIQWLKMGGGMFTKGTHPPAHKFNAGQKMIFWIVIVGGAVLSFTGYMLLFPAQAGGAVGWQLMQTIHALTAAVMTAMIIAHIYLGSIGMQGAFDAMGSGEVDENWAKEHHSLWYKKMKESKGAAQKTGSAAHPAE